MLGDGKDELVGQAREGTAFLIIHGVVDFCILDFVGNLNILSKWLSERQLSKSFGTWVGEFKVMSGTFCSHVVAR